MNIINVAHAQEELIPTAVAETESHADTGVLASLGLNGTLFTFQLLNFALVAVTIWFLILKPLTKKMTERQKMIDESLENAKKVEENLRRSELKYQERIDQAKVDANKLAEKAAASTEEVVTQMKAKAEKEIEQLVEKAKTHISDEHGKMVSELKTQTVGVIVDALEKMLKEKVTAAKDQEIIQDLVNKLK